MQHNTYVKKYLKSLITREMQIKTKHNCLLISLAKTNRICKIHSKNRKNGNVYTLD